MRPVVLSGPGREQQGKQLGLLRDFLLVYNRLTELCFERCVPSLHYRALAPDEEACLDSCAGKFVRSNHRLMAAYMQLMPTLVQRRVADLEAGAAAAGVEPAAPPGPESGEVPSPQLEPKDVPAGQRSLSDPTG
uniref:Mitochondrial import inner membrane translocase subunit n=1 Tax=Ornithorhynchus anatinus TaxID=9258 RepID=A0A6I8P688_ORNAN